MEGHRFGRGGRVEELAAIDARAGEVAAQLARGVHPQGPLGPKRPAAPGERHEAREHGRELAVNGHATRAVSFGLPDLARLVARAVDMHGVVQEIDVLTVEGLQLAVPGVEVDRDGVDLAHGDLDRLARKEPRGLRRIEKLLGAPRPAVRRAHALDGVVGPHTQVAGLPGPGVVEELGEDAPRVERGLPGELPLAHLLVDRLDPHLDVVARHPGNGQCAERGPNPGAQAALVRADALHVTEAPRGEPPQAPPLHGLLSVGRAVGEVRVGRLVHLHRAPLGKGQASRAGERPELLGELAGARLVDPLRQPEPRAPSHGMGGGVLRKGDPRAPDAVLLLDGADREDVRHEATLMHLGAVARGDVREHLRLARGGLRSGPGRGLRGTRGEPCVEVFPGAEHRAPDPRDRKGPSPRGLQIDPARETPREVMLIVGLGHGGLEARDDARDELVELRRGELDLKHGGLRGAHNHPSLQPSQSVSAGASTGTGCGHPSTAHVRAAVGAGDSVGAVAAVPSPVTCAQATHAGCVGVARGRVRSLRPPSCTAS